MGMQVGALMALPLLVMEMLPVIFPAPAHSESRRLGCSIVLMLAIAVAAGAAAEPSAPAIGAVQKAVSDWARVREETVRLETTWEQESQLLRSTLNAMQERARTLSDEKKGLVAKTASDRNALNTLATENAETQAALDAAVTRLKKACDELNSLRPMLPPRLSRALELPYRSLANPQLPLGERMQFVTTVLNRCAQFNNTITYDEEPLAIEGENQVRLLEVIYWGASHAYALDRTTEKAYFGAPGAGGWSWQPMADAAKPVAELVAIYREKSDPRFVEVPAQISHALTN
jgi:hypothetical protein